MAYSGKTCAICDTGPLISAFQSGSFALMVEIFHQIVIPSVCRTGLEEHGWIEELTAASFLVRAMKLTANEASHAIGVASRIAKHPASKKRVSESHLGEAGVIVLALRSEHRQDVALIDELAARGVASDSGLAISGFPGVLLLAARGGLISAEEVRARLKTCRQQGTHYSESLVRQVYNMAASGRR